MFELCARIAAAAVAGVLAIAVLASLLPGYASVDGPVVVPLGRGHGIHLLDVLLGSALGVGTFVVTRRRQE
jgi:hypothetical protein